MSTMKGASRYIGFLKLGMVHFVGVHQVPPSSNAFLEPTSLDFLVKHSNCFEIASDIKHSVAVFLSTRAHLDNIMLAEESEYMVLEANLDAFPRVYISRPVHRHAVRALSHQWQGCTICSGAASPRGT